MKTNPAITASNGGKHEYLVVDEVKTALEETMIFLGKSMNSLIDRVLASTN